MRVCVCSADFHRYTAGVVQTNLLAIIFNRTVFLRTRTSVTVRILILLACTRRHTHTHTHKAMHAHTVRVHPSRHINDITDVEPKRVRSCIDARTHFLCLLIRASFDHKVPRAIIILLAFHLSSTLVRSNLSFTRLYLVV